MNEYMVSNIVQLKIGALHLTEHPKLSTFTTVDGYWFKRKGLVHVVWIGGTPVPPIDTKLSQFSDFYKSTMPLCLNQKTFNLLNLLISECFFQVTCPIVDSARLEHGQLRKALPFSFRVLQIHRRRSAVHFEVLETLYSLDWDPVFLFCYASPCFQNCIYC